MLNTVSDAIDLHDEVHQGDEAHGQRIVQDRGRNSVFMMANLRLQTFAEPIRVRIRDISTGGLKGSGASFPSHGEAVTVELPNIGTVRAKVVWAREKDFGLEFAQAIDVDAVRTKVTGSLAKPDTPAHTARKFFL